VIVEVKKSDGKSKPTHDDTVHLASGPHVGDDDSHEDDLNEGHLGHDETLFNGLNFNRRFWGSVHRLSGVTWHF